MLQERDKVTVEDPDMQLSGTEKCSTFSRFMAGSLPQLVTADIENIVEKCREENPYVSLISRRPIPKPTNVGPTKTGKGLEYMLPCGFRESNQREKYWFEIVTGLLS